MLVIFDLNKTIIKPRFGNKRNNEKGYVIRPHFKELYSFLKENGVKVGLYSFCRAKKFREVVRTYFEFTTLVHVGGWFFAVFFSF